MFDFQFILLMAVVGTILLSTPAYSLFCVVTQRFSALEALHDDPNDGCLGGLVTRWFQAFG